MSTEELQMILDAMAGAGQGAFWVAMAYLASGILETFIICGAVLCTVLVVARIVKRGMDNCGDLNKFRAAAGCDEPWGPMTERERKIVLRAIRDGRKIGRAHV